MSIVQLFKARVKPADRFEKLLSPYIDGLYHFACRLCQSTDDAEDLLQQLLTRLFQKLAELEQVESLRPWLFRSLYNLYVDSYRKQRRMSAVISAEDIPQDEVTKEKDPYEEAELSQNQTIILAAVDQLNSEQRLVLLLHDAEGYTLTELADILQTPLGTLKSRLHRARNRVKELTEMELSGNGTRVYSKEELK